MKRACRILITALALVLVFAGTTIAAGNATNDSFKRTKGHLAQVYADHRITFYCGAEYDESGNVVLPDGFVTPSYHKRAERVEWEHVVPAENFGRAFAEWRNGSPQCVDNQGRTFKGRRCAEKANMEYRHIQADMHNLTPAIGAVNALRRNYNFALLPDAENTFGTCAMKIQGNKVEPPEAARGMIARIYKYMAGAYPSYQMGRPQHQLLDAWDKMYPPDAWECARAKRVEAIQGNENFAVKNQCLERGLWHDPKRPRSGRRS